MTRTQAIRCDATQPLSVQTAEPVSVEAADLEVAVRFSGIRTGPKRRLRNGSVPPFPGPGVFLAPGCEAAGTLNPVRVRDTHEREPSAPPCLSPTVDGRARWMV